MQPLGKRRRADARRLWAYLADPMPTEGPGRLLEQRRAVDRTAALEQRRIDRYVIDSGSATNAGRGANLQAMIDEIRVERRRVTLIIAAASHLAPTPEAIRGAMADLLAAGFVLKDGSGELHPAAATVALAAAAVGATPCRRTQCDLERNDV